VLPVKNIFKIFCLAAAVVAGSQSVHAEPGKLFHKIAGTTCGGSATVSCRFSKGETTKQSHTWDEAICSADKYGQLKPTNVKTCELQLKTGFGTQQQRINATIALAYSYASSDLGRPITDHRAIPLLKDLSATHPDNTDVLFAMVRVTSWPPQPSTENWQTIEKLIGIAPDDWRGHYLKTRYILDRGHNALEASNQMVKVAPENPIALALHASILVTEKRQLEAITFYEKANSFVNETNYALPGLSQEDHFWPSWARLADETQGPKAAAKIMEDYLRNEPLYANTQDNILQLAGYLAKEARYLEAANLIKSAGRKLGRLKPEDIHVHYLLMRLKAGGFKITQSEFDSVPSKNQLRRVLKLQVMLRNSGFTTVEINGKFDEATAQGLEECAIAADCGAISWLKL
jgi:tetratricopeptide (TPR) repeat protein